MSNEATFRLDGKSIAFQPGDTIMDAALRAGEYIPHLCHNPEFKPHGSCRVCIVDIGGRKVSACTHPASAGLEVANNSEEITLQRFLPKFNGESGEYSTDGFEILAVRPATKPADQVFVDMQVQRASGPEVVLVWRLRKVDEGYKILDISVEGISMALTLREEYSSVIRQKGGVGPLVAMLQEKLAVGAYAPPAESGAQ